MRVSLRLGEPGRALGAHLRLVHRHCLDVRAFCLQIRVVLTVQRVFFALFSVCASGWWQRRKRVFHGSGPTALSMLQCRWSTCPGALACSKIAPPRPVEQLKEG